MNKHLGFLVAACLAAATASGAYLEGEADRPASEPVRPHPPVLPPSGSLLPALAQRVTVGPPMHWSHLTFYPLELRTRHGGTGILTLDEAMQRGQLAIREVGGGQVGRLAVRNDANQPVLLMAGELVLGGKQNRMVREDVLLERRSAWHEIEVYCGEQHRWKEGGAFKSGGTLSAPALRRMAAGRAAQDRIWGEIGTQLEAADVAAPTANYQEVFSHPERQRRLEACVTHLRPLPGPRTIGCVAVSHRGIEGADLFSDPRLFASLWPKLCRSYASDAVIPYPTLERHHRHFDRPEHHPSIRQFLNLLNHTRYNRRSTPGMGILWGLHGPVEGTSLEHVGGVVHAGLFSAPVTYHPMPFPRDEH